MNADTGAYVWHYQEAPGEAWDYDATSPLMLADLKINGFTVHTQLNEEVLRQIAALTDGTYYQANNAADLKSVYDNINPEPVVEPQKTEITPLFAGASLLVLLIGSVASLAWFGRVP